VFLLAKLVVNGAELFFKEWGDGQPVVFSHGWPLSSDAFEDQMFYLAQRGYRCIAHDRRGHGRSLTVESLLVEEVVGATPLLSSNKKTKI
jgi:pimeloyl-ACP methyl ester carboxylesterase